MIPKINGLGRSFAGVAAYCLHDAPEPDDRRPRTSERVGWADTRNLATIRVERAARLMAATARAAPDLKRLAGVARGGRKLAKPVLHYSLSWARDETPDKREMNRAVDESLEALGLEGHEALIVAHEDTRHPHVHVIANRVDPETGKAATLGNSKLRLSRWAEGYEREQGRIRCDERVNNERRRAGREVVHHPWDRPLHWARYRREVVPGRVRRARRPVDEGLVDTEAWRRAEERLWEQVEDRRWLGFWRLESRARKEWAELRKRQEDTRQRLDRESRTSLGRSCRGVQRVGDELEERLSGPLDLLAGLQAGHGVRCGVELLEGGARLQKALGPGERPELLVRGPDQLLGILPATASVLPLDLDGEETGAVMVEEGGEMVAQERVGIRCQRLRDVAAPQPPANDVAVLGLDQRVVVRAPGPRLREVRCPIGNGVLRVVRNVVRARRYARRFRRL